MSGMSGSQTSGRGRPPKSTSGDDAHDDVERALVALLRSRTAKSNAVIGENDRGPMSRLNAIKRM